MKQLRTWVLVADGARAQIYENTGPEHALVAVEGLDFKGDHSATHDLVSDKQGRSFSSKGPGRSAIEPHSDPHRDLKTKFAHHLADVLGREFDQGHFHRLIIAAPPATLGDLRHSVPAKVRAIVTGELAHDLTKTPVHELGGHFREMLFA